MRVRPLRMFEFDIEIKPSKELKAALPKKAWFWEDKRSVCQRLSINHKNKSKTWEVELHFMIDESFNIFAIKELEENHNLDLVINLLTNKRKVANKLSLKKCSIEKMIINGFDVSKGDNVEFIIKLTAKTFN